MSKELKGFDPNGPGIRNHLFGLPYSPNESSIVIIPVPWEATVTYHTGTIDGPEAVLKASVQIDHGDKDNPKSWALPVAMLPIPEKLKKESRRVRELLALHKKAHHKTDPLPDDPVVVKVNEACENLLIYVRTTTQRLLRQGKLVGLLGGDHSVALGYMQGLAHVHERFGILQIDAHADLRKAYEGITYSHASIMHNALKIKNVEKLVQVGIRDYGDDELAAIAQARGRILTYFDADIKKAQYKGKTWDAICQEIVNSLPPLVYISFDIDGLEPSNCPSTGTPVPGGLQFTEATYLIQKVVESGRKIIGFDLCEVAPGIDEWDANVGARILHKLTLSMGISQGLITPQR